MIEWIIEINGKLKQLNDWPLLGLGTSPDAGSVGREFRQT